jgi:hypothetical protein
VVDFSRQQQQMHASPSPVHHAEVLSPRYHAAMTPQSQHNAYAQPLTPGTPMQPPTPGSSQGAQTPQPPMTPQERHFSNPTTPVQHQAFAAGHMDMQFGQQQQHQQAMLNQEVGSNDSMSPEATPSKVKGTLNPAGDDHISPPDPNTKGPYSIMCLYCSSTSKNKSDFYRHLSERHFRAQLAQELPTAAPFQCPVENCQYITKDNTVGPLFKHYGNVHKMVQKFFTQPIVGKFVPSETKVANAAKPEPVRPAPPPAMMSAGREPHPGFAPPIHAHHVNAEPDMLQPTTAPATMSNQALKLKCPFCEVMFAARYPFHQHLCDKHFKDVLGKSVPLQAPFLCPVQGCNYVAKDSRQSLIRHYGMTHKVVNELLKSFAPGFDDSEAAATAPSAEDSTAYVDSAQHHAQMKMTMQQPPQHAPLPQHQHMQQQHAHQQMHPHALQQAQQPHVAYHQPPQHAHVHQQHPGERLPPMPGFFTPPPVEEFGYGHQPQMHHQQLPGRDFGQPLYPQQQPHNDIKFDQQIDGTFDPTHYSDHSLDENSKSLPTTPSKSEKSISPTAASAKQSVLIKVEEPLPVAAPKAVTPAPPAAVTPVPSSAEADLPTPATPASASKASKAQPRVCEICKKQFDGKNKAMLYVQHMAQHFKDKLFADLVDKTPPYRCPMEGCSYKTKHKPDWARHYGSVHKLLEKYKKEFLESEAAISGLQAKLEDPDQPDESDQQEEDQELHTLEDDVSQIISNVMKQENSLAYKQALQLEQPMDTSSHHLDLIDQVLRQQAASGPSSLHCFMCDEVFQSEDALNVHLSESHLVFIKDKDRLEVLNPDDLEASLITEEDKIELYAAEDDEAVMEDVSAASTSRAPVAALLAQANASEKKTPAASARPCEICGFEPKTKNKSRERQDHLAMKHYKERITSDLASVPGHKCPVCDYVGKDRQTVYRHYTGKHKVVEQYLADDIKAGRVQLFSQQQQAPVAAGFSATINTMPSLPAFVTEAMQQAERSSARARKDCIMQLDGGFDDDLLDQLDGGATDGADEDDYEDEEEEALMAAQQSASNSGGNLSSTQCPLCAAPTKKHTLYHLATSHFKQRLTKIHSGQKPFICGECGQTAKTKINLWVHYLGTHRYGQVWLKESLLAGEIAKVKDEVKDVIEIKTEPALDEIMDVHHQEKEEKETPSLETSEPAEAEAPESKAGTTSTPSTRNGGDASSCRRMSTSRFWCDLCQNNVVATKIPHFATAHFEDKLKLMLPQSRPFLCSLCRFEAKSYANLTSHFMSKHCLLDEWIREAVWKMSEEVVAKEGNAADTSVSSAEMDREEGDFFTVRSFANV